MPPSARKGVMEEGFKSSSQIGPPSEFKLSSQAVAVVPRLAPITTLAACVTFMIPELTRPTVMTVVTEDCTNTARVVPKIQPLIRFSVILLIMPLRLPPAICDSAELIVFIPKIKRATPLIIPVTRLNICIKLISRIPSLDALSFSSYFCCLGPVFRFRLNLHTCASYGRRWPGVLFSAPISFSGI